VLDWRKHSKETVRRAKEEQKKLKRLTDEQLMELEDTLTAEYRDDRSPEAVAAFEPSPSLVRQLAVMYETDRRYIAAGWFWRRWRHPEKLEKWDKWKRRHMDEDGNLLPSAAVEMFGYQNTLESLSEALLNSYEEFVRGQAAAALGDLGDSSAVPALIDALQDESKEVRGHCVVSLMTLKDKKAVTPLTKLLTDDDSEVRGLAAAALGEIGNRKAIKPLIKTLGRLALEDRDEDESTAYFLVALDRLCTRVDIPLIIDALRDFGEDFSGVAIVILKHLCDENDIPFLKSVVRDESEDVRMIAAAILAKLGDGSGLADLLEDTSEEGRRVALAAAALFGELDKL